MRRPASAAHLLLPFIAHQRNEEPMSILILEDDAAVARAYATALRNDGHEVAVCTAFEEARECLKGDRPSALLTDIRVRQYNGLQLAMLFREVCPDGKVVVVTGHDDRVIRSEVAALNGAFLVKPISLAQLRDLFSSSRPS
jgi:DNA-binding NtrC family response regulator